MDVSAMLQKLRVSYLTELPGRLDDIENSIMKLENFGFDEENFNTLFRLVHSLKGSGGTYGMHVISDICHPLEDMLSGLSDFPQKLNKQFIDIALAYVDLLRKIVDDFTKYGDGRYDPTKMLQALRKKAFPEPFSALIVENSPVIIGIIKQNLDVLNARMEVVDDGYVALGRALAVSFDYLITGMEVKRLNGVALIGALRLAQGKTPLTKTILLTANTLTLPSAVKPNHVLLKDSHFQSNLQAVLTMGK
jgi:CheY-like chemotaxis protein/HPt (histidine-containing phosphotransfer) domain-containing protein